MSTNEKKSKKGEKTDKIAFSEKKRYRGKLVKTENKTREAVVKARAKKAGQEAVSDQKSHEYH
jgi:hypothetical protein